MRDEIRSLAGKEPGPETASGRTKWTRAVWQYFDTYYREAHNWDLYPKTKPVKGRVAGEYMTDFALIDGRGYRIACESQWGEGLDQIDWAFDKLRAVKAEIKILIFERKHDSSGQMPADVSNMVKGYIAECGNHHAGHEFYLFLQFSGDMAKLYIWEPSQLDGYDIDSIDIQPIA
jgi:hypothetical protein